MSRDRIQSGSFLSKAAEDINLRANKEVANLTLIFTNRRAIRFFGEEYEALQEGFYWKPECRTISDFVEQYSPYSSAEELSLIYILYKSYKRIYYSHNPLSQTEEEEPFENFYFWGKTLLGDFDDVDKNLADAAKLYVTLSESKEMEDLFDFLEPEQKDILSKYFDNFRKLYCSESNLQHNFVRIWNCLLEVYDNYRKSLSELGIAYGGMMYRDLVEKIERGEVSFEGEEFAFVGFNVLNKVERELFKAIGLRSKADFYWDYDTYYTEDPIREAGLFMRENLRDFPHSESFSRNNFSQIQSSDCHIEILSSAYESSQALYIKEWIGSLEQQYGKSLRQNTLAIILQNESLLPFVLKSLPEQINGEPTKVNITMGYPFKYSSLYTDMSAWLNRHSETSLGAREQLEELVEFVKSKALEENSDNQTKEAAYRVVIALEDLGKTLRAIQEELPKDFVHRTIIRLLQRQTMPFESEATDGVQIMGLLESRNLDFSHVLMLSCTNTLLPSIGNSITFIPHSLRQVFDLTTTERKVAVYAYYFYRLLHNAKSIHYIYNTISSSKDSEEMSCFLQQLRVEFPLGIGYKTLSLSQKNEIISPCLPAKRPEDLSLLLKRKCNFENPHSYLSPSVLTDYIDCPLKFYYKHILRLEAPKEDDDKTSLVFGTFFHASAEHFELSGRKASLAECMEQAYEQLKQEEKGLISQFHRDMVENYLRGLQSYYERMPDRHFQEAEKEFVMNVAMEGMQLKFGGKIDRIDQEGENLILCDYKTGGNDEQYKQIDSLFEPEKADRAKYLFQIMFYAWLLWKQKPIGVQILYIHKLQSKDYKPKVLTYDLQTHNQFDQKIKEYIKELFDTSEGKMWNSKPSEKKCRYCDFSSLCPNPKK